MYQEWFQQGLAFDNTLPEVLKICQIETLQDLYLLIQMSAPLKAHLTMIWEAGSLICTTKMYEQAVPSSEAVLEPITPNSSVQMVNDFQSWSDLHRTVFPFILQWTQETESSLAKYWKHAIKLGIGGNSTWADIQEILHLDTYRDYYYAIVTCPNISRIVKLHFDTTTDLLHYKVQSNIHPVHVTPVPQQKSRPKTADLALPNLETHQNDLAGNTFAFVHHTVYHVLLLVIQEPHPPPQLSKISIILQ